MINQNQWRTFITSSRSNTVYPPTAAHNTTIAISCISTLTKPYYNQYLTLPKLAEDILKWAFGHEFKLYVPDSYDSNTPEDKAVCLKQAINNHHPLLWFLKGGNVPDARKTMQHFLALNEHNSTGEALETLRTSTPPFAVVGFSDNSVALNLFAAAGKKAFHAPHANDFFYYVLANNENLLSFTYETSNRNRDLTLKRLYALRSILGDHLITNEYNGLTPYHEPFVSLIDNNLTQSLDEFVSKNKAKPLENKTTSSFMALKKLFDDHLQKTPNVSSTSHQVTPPHPTTTSDDALIWGGNANVLYDMNQQNLLNPALEQLKRWDPNRKMILAIEAIDSRFYQTLLPDLIHNNSNYIDGIVEGQILSKIRTGPVEKPAGTITLTNKQAATINHQMHQERKELMDSINKKRAKPLPIISDKRFGHFERGINMPFHLDSSLQKQALTPQNTPSIA